MEHGKAVAIIIGLCICAFPAAAQNRAPDQKTGTSSLVLEKSQENHADDTTPLPTARRFLKDDPALLRVRLRPGRPRTVPRGATDTIRTAAFIWNHFGGLIEVLSRQLGVEPEVALALVAAESGGRAFSDDRLVIRFENHCFWHYWGQHHEPTFNRHFTFGRNGDLSRGHTFRASTREERKPVHIDQPAREWTVFRFAESLDRRAAILSTSWGLGQIMGFNADRAGYSSPEMMVSRFNDGDAGTHWQLIAIFDYVSRGGERSRALTAFRNRDWPVVAREYNGSNVREYAQRLRDYYAAARRLVP